MSEPAVEVERLAGAQAFLDVAGPFLAEREAEHNLLFGIAANLIRDPDRRMSSATVLRSDPPRERGGRRGTDDAAIQRGHVVDR